MLVILLVSGGLLHGVGDDFSHILTTLDGPCQQIAEVDPTTRYVHDVADHRDRAVEVAGMRTTAAYHASGPGAAEAYPPDLQPPNGQHRAHRAHRGAHIYDGGGHLCMRAERSGVQTISVYARANRLPTRCVKSARTYHRNWGYKNPVPNPAECVTKAVPLCGALTSHALIAFLSRTAVVMAQNRVIDVDDGELESFLRRRMTKRQQIAQCFPGRYRLYRMNNAMVERLYEQVKDQIKLVPEFKYGMVPAKTSADTESGKATPPAGENELSPTHSGNEPSGGELKQSGAESPYMPPGEDRSQVGEARQAVCGEDVGRSGEVGVVSPTRNSPVRWVDENASMSQRAADFDASAMGSRSNVLTQRGQAPQVMRTLPDGSQRGVRFDGFDRANNLLIDRKLSVVTTSKAQNQALRQSQALSENGLSAVWEVTTQTQANRATRMFGNLGIDNISVRVVGGP